MNEKKKKIQEKELEIKKTKKKDLLLLSFYLTPMPVVSDMGKIKIKRGKRIRRRKKTKYIYKRMYKFTLKGSLN